jgi:hypothetical protein
LQIDATGAGQRRTRTISESAGGNLGRKVAATGRRLLPAILQQVTRELNSQLPPKCRNTATGSRPIPNFSLKYKVNHVLTAFSESAAFVFKTRGKADPVAKLSQLWFDVPETPAVEFDAVR